MPRDYQAEHIAREARAHDRGYGSYYEERQARSFAYDMGADRGNVERYAGLFHNYDSGHVDASGEWHNGGMDIDDFRAVYADLNDIDIDDIDDRDFYDWLQEFYSDT